MEEARVRRLQHLLLEGLVIVFSVFIALVAENLWAEREARRGVDEALEALVSEVVANADELERFGAVVSDRYERLLALASSIDGSRPFSEYVGGFGGYQLPDLDRSAWSRISIDPLANRIASAQLRDAFVLYRGQELLLGLDDEVTRLVFGPVHHDPEQALIAYGISERILWQQVQFAREVATQHRTFLEQYR